jgi:hypothetical protein
MDDLPPAAERVYLTDLAKREGVHNSTTCRWGMRGIRGHKLPTWMFAGRRCTSEQAFRDWLASLNSEPIRSETPRQRQRQIEEAERLADEMGL